MIKPKIDWEFYANKIRNSKHTIVFTGAGISVESGIPPFRGAKGIWNKYDPSVLNLSYFKRDPERAWVAIKEIFYDFLEDAKPNDAHYRLTDLEKLGFIKSIITQNIDGLHHKSGTKNVIEFHGTTSSLVCLKCGNTFDVKDIDLNNPRCSNDMEFLKPNFVFFEEGIPEEAFNMSFSEALISDLVIIIGTTGEVMPANMVPYQAKRNGAEIIEINPTPSSFTDRLTDYFIKSSASTALNNICRYFV
jgi:NAD-dependent deacetylase